MESDQSPKCHLHMSSLVDVLVSRLVVLWSVCFCVHTGSVMVAVLVRVLLCVFQVYMACQSMLIVLVGAEPQQQQSGGGVSVQPELQQLSSLSQDVDSIVTEVRDGTTAVTFITHFITSVSTLFSTLSVPQQSTADLCCSLSLCPSVVPHQAAGLQGQPGRVAVLHRGSGRECRLRAAVRQDRQEARLPHR